MLLIGLDPGIHVGWAVLDTETAELSYGTHNLVAASRSYNRSPGLSLLRFDGWFRALLYRATGQTVIQYEIPHCRGFAVTLLLMGQVATVQKLAVQRTDDGMPTEFVGMHTNTLKKQAAGSGRAGKPELIAAARRLWGLAEDDTMDEHAADALCLLHLLRCSVAI